MTEPKTAGPDLDLTDGRDLKTDLLGRVMRDTTGVAARARRRLLIRRGQWVGDPAMGSRLHQLKTLRSVQREAETVILEALEPLFRDGSATTAKVQIVEIDRLRGHAEVSVELVVPNGELVPLGTYPLG